MCIKVAQAIASYQEKKGLDPEHIVPSMEDKDLFEYEAFESAKEAIRQGLNRINVDDKELRSKIKHRLEQGRKSALQST